MSFRATSATPVTHSPCPPCSFFNTASLGKQVYLKSKIGVGGLYDTQETTSGEVYLDVMHDASEYPGKSLSISVRRYIFPTPKLCVFSKGMMLCSLNAGTQSLTAQSVIFLREHCLHNPL